MLFSEDKLVKVPDFLPSAPTFPPFVTVLVAFVAILRE